MIPFYEAQKQTKLIYNERVKISAACGEELETDHEGTSRSFL